MDSPPSDHISEPGTVRCEVQSQTSSTADESEEHHERGEAQPMATPTYRPPGYPSFGAVWTQPPQPLPGPEDHPFFKWIAEGAKKDPAVLATMRTVPAASQATLPIRAVPSPHSVLQPRAVYPFVPSPTIAMEPYTPNQEERKSFIQSSSAHTTPELSSSPTDPSPASAQTVTPANARKDVVTAPTEESDKTAESATDSSAAKDETTQSEETSPESVANGQIWRSGSKRDGWRRHQWSLDVG